MAKTCVSVRHFHNATIIKGYCTSSTIYFCMDQQIHAFRQTFESGWSCGSIRWTSAITLLLCTWYFNFSTCYVILSRILHRKAHFDTEFLPMFFLFMPVGHIHVATAGDLGNADETNDWILFKHIAYTSGQSGIKESSSLKNRVLLHDRSNGKV